MMIFQHLAIEVTCREDINLLILSGNLATARHLLWRDTRKRRLEKADVLPSGMFAATTV